MKVQRWLAGAAVTLVAGAAGAACLSDAQAQALADQYLMKAPATDLEAMSEADGTCSRAKFTALLEKKMGPVIGYKAGLTNPAVQKRFGTDRPVWGKLFQGMLVQDGATVDVGFGARPLFEADLLVRVKSPAINQAKTPQDVLDNIDAVIPFIELPDLVVQTPPKLNGNGLSAINVGARSGVVGKPIPVPLYRAERFAMLDGLRDMTVVLADGSGAELGRGKGSDILQHPLNAVVWLAEALGKEGLAMKPGDLISLGSFSPLVPPKAGQKATVDYIGLPGATRVSVQFR